MITIVNQDNQDKYNALYARAMSDLRKTNDPELVNVQINSLETYFGKIEQLLKLSKAGTKNYGRTYTILPLDEEYFTIDTNTRQITVPEAFRKNGIAVQGDMGAETVYFKVPRYFDAMDLDRTNIYIQWQYTNSQSGQLEQGISHEWVRDIESEDDYLIFGWTLGGRITEEAGTLQFSVRFINGKRDDEDKITEISYSLSTLTTTVLINPGLNFGLEEVQIEELDHIINYNYKNTTTTTDSQIDIFQYVWDLDKYYIGTETPTTSIIEQDLDEQGKIKIELKAYSDPGDIVKYYLYKQTGTQPSVNQDSATEMSMDIVLQATGDKYYQENGLRMYYKDAYIPKNFGEEGNGYEPNKYYIFNEEKEQYELAGEYVPGIPYYMLTPLARYYPNSPNDIALPAGVYEKNGEIILAATEKEYYFTNDEIIKENKIYYKLEDDEFVQIEVAINDNPKQLGYYEKLKTKYISNIAGTYYGVTKVIINDNESGPQYTNYQLSIPKPMEVVLDNENIKYTGKECMVKTEGNGISSYPALAAILKEYGEKDKISYTWYKVKSQQMSENGEIQFQDLEKIVTVEDSNTFTPSSTGIYCAEIMATRNYTNSDKIKTGNYFVTLPPAKPVFDVIPGPDSIQNPIRIHATVNNNTEIAASKTVYRLHSVDYTTGKPSFNKIAEIVVDSTSEETVEFTVNTRGPYTCSAYSIYNNEPSEEVFLNNAFYMG